MEEPLSDNGPPPLISSEFPPLSSSLTPSIKSSAISAPFSPSPLHASPALPPPATVHTTSNEMPPHSEPLNISNSLWKDLFTRNSPHPKHYPPPSYTAEGVPVVKAPPSILLKTSETWKNYIICHFFGTPPSLRKIHSDLNPIWGKKGSIQVQYYTELACLILIPNISMRNWVLNVGFWSAGTVAFAVSLWSPSSSLKEQSLSSAPVWLSLQGVPPQLRSREGLAVVASGVGVPLPPAADAKAPSFGLIPPKIRAVVRLDKGPLPSSVIVVDDDGAQVVVGVQYIALPPLCPSCNKYGHRSHRCPLRARAPFSEKQSVPFTPMVTQPESRVANPASVNGDLLPPSLQDDSLGFTNVSGPNQADTKHMESLATLATFRAATQATISGTSALVSDEVLLSPPSPAVLESSPATAAEDLSPQPSGSISSSTIAALGFVQSGPPTHLGPNSESVHFVPSPALRSASPTGPMLEKPILSKPIIAPVSQPINYEPFLQIPTSFKPIENHQLPKPSATNSVHKVILPSIQKAQPNSLRNQDPSNSHLLPHSPSLSSVSTFTSLLLQQIEHGEASSSLLLTEDALLESILTEHHRTQIKKHQRFPKKNNEKAKDQFSKEKSKDLVRKLGPRFFPIFKRYG